MKKRAKAQKGGKMANKHLQALKERNKARIEQATDADEIARLQEEQKEIEALEAEEKKLLSAYKTALTAGSSKEEDEDEGGTDEDDDEETGGKGKKPLSFSEALGKIKKQRKNN